jgi:hypothetical protein
VMSAGAANDLASDPVKVRITSEVGHVVEQAHPGLLYAVNAPISTKVYPCRLKRLQA